LLKIIGLGMKNKNPIVQGFKIVGIGLTVIAFLIGSWAGMAWVLGWSADRLFDFAFFNPSVYVAFGSCILIFTLGVLVITLSLLVWFLLTWGKYRVKKVMSE